jgi:mxaA protein
MRRARHLAALAWLMAAGPATHAADEVLRATPQDPRAFGHFVGDVVTRRISVRLPAAWQLDAESLPRAGRQGQALELRKVAWQRGALGAADHATLTLDYQVFLAPREVRTLEMPPVLLRFTGGPRAETLRIDAWPVTVAPLVPLEVSPRHGLGAWRPDAPPPLIDTRAHRWRLGVYGLVAAALLACLAHVYLGLPWLARRARPFGQAWRVLRGLSAGSSADELRAGMQHLHQALNATAGRVVFENGVDAFVEAHPRFGPMRADLLDFFARSRQEFFGQAQDPHDARAAAVEAGWLLALCRRARDVERGSA